MRWEKIQIGGPQGLSGAQEKKITWLFIRLSPPEADSETRIPGQVVYLGSEGNNDRRVERGHRKGTASDQVL